MLTFYAFAEAGGDGYVELTIPSGAVSANLTDFPVYVDLADMPADFWSTVDAAGAEIRVKSVDGLTTYPCDVVAIDTGAETGHLFFKADLLTGSDNEFRIHYDTGLGAPAVTDPEGRNAVWSNFTRVYDGVANVDRTGNGAALTLVSATFTGGKIVFGSSNNAAYVAISQPTHLSFFVIGYVYNNSASHKTCIGYAQDYAATPSRLGLNIRSNNKWATWNTTNTWLESTVTETFNRDYTVGYTHNAGTGRTIYHNGASVGSDANAVALYAGSGAGPVLILGAEDSSLSEEMQTDVVLALYAARVISPAEMAALHDNRRDSASFYTVS